MWLSASRMPGWNALMKLLLTCSCRTLSHTDTMLPVVWPLSPTHIIPLVPFGETGKLVVPQALPGPVLVQHVCSRQGALRHGWGQRVKSASHVQLQPANCSHTVPPESVAKTSSMNCDNGTGPSQICIGSLPEEEGGNLAA